MSTPNDKVSPSVYIKRRYIWQPGGLRLLREAAWSQYAQRAVAPIVNGMHIEFPETETALGFCVKTTTRRLEGPSLLSLLYDPCHQTAAVDMGMTVLEAFHSANLDSAPSDLFGWVFRWFKGLRLIVRTAFDASSLSDTERKELRRLVARYVLGKTGSRVLVHGDLHASHVLVDSDNRTFGIIDLETMHIGKAATNFAQLWDGYHHADPALGQQLYRRYADQYPGEMDEQFDDDLRLEAALRSHTHIRAGRLTGNTLLVDKAQHLLHGVLSGVSFQSLCTERKPS
jgi:hypothetical protein